MVESLALMVASSVNNPLNSEENNKNDQLHSDMLKVPGKFSDIIKPKAIYHNIMYDQINS